ncbi:hypothetical protein CCH79_00015297 [Gambusia affinis]|uniref:Uncharacterized protein n=1 Tax=Gambusia affinis TaxID=33528 RepID=A0A315W3E6_GAMAF|nr:hypothetical protein CCH79_00015297 [Gambusia affinis]
MIDNFPLSCCPSRLISCLAKVLHRPVVSHHQRTVGVEVGQTKLVVVDGAVAHAERSPGWESALLKVAAFIMLYMRLSEKPFQSITFFEYMASGSTGDRTRDYAVEIPVISPEAAGLHWGPRHSSVSMGPQLVKETPFTFPMQSQSPLWTLAVAQLLSAIINSTKATTITALHHAYPLWENPVRIRESFERDRVSEPGPRAGDSRTARPGMTASRSNKPEVTYGGTRSSKVIEVSYILS